MVSKKDKPNWYFIILGLVILSSLFLPDKKMYENDLVTETLILKNDIQRINGKNSNYIYRFWTTNYKSSFIILKAGGRAFKSDALNGINKSDTIIVRIHNTRLSDLQDKYSDIPIYSLEKSGKFIFDYNHYKKSENTISRIYSILAIIMGGLLLLCGLTIISIKLFFILFASSIITIIITFRGFKLPSITYLEPVKLLFIVLLLVTLSIIFLYIWFVGPKITALRLKKRLSKKSEHRFESITQEGFQFIDWQIQENVKWSEVESIEFVLSETYTNEIILDAPLEIRLIDKRVLRVEGNCERRLEFLKKVPLGIQKFDYRIVENYFSSLKPCKICGFYSVYKGVCLNCDYSRELERDYKKENKNESIENFYKEEQLDYFTVYFDSNESANETLRKARQSELYVIDDNWKIYPSSQEISEEKKRWQKK